MAINQLDLPYNTVYKMSSPMPFWDSQNIEKISYSNQIKKESFSKFVESRSLYLNKLRSLGDNWISGTSLQPSDASINLAIDFLRNANKWYKDKDELDKIGNRNIIPNVPKIIMSPTPSGGIGIEIKFSFSLKMYISIINEDVYCEIENDGFFMEYPMSGKNLFSSFLNIFNNYERGYYSGWRNFI